MDETQATIAAWAEDVFGPVQDLVVLVERAQEELHELAAEVRSGDFPKAAAEIADVVILLKRLAHLMGHDLSASVQEKMATNRQRTWVRAGNGVGRHKKA